MDFLTYSFQSESLALVQKEIKSLVKSAFPVLITGHSGTGKTSWALSLAKAKGNFVTVEANQAPRSLKDWKTLLTDATLKVIVLEDIDRWSESVQNSLSTLLRESTRFDKYFISTASSDLSGLVSDGQFRNDLYHRLSIRPVELPRLSECGNDLFQLTNFWLDVHSLVMGCKKPAVSEEAFKKLEMIKWQSDWTEFVTVLERALSYAAEVIQPEHLIITSTQSGPSRIEAGLTLAEMEKKLILQTLKLTASNKSQAARVLGISIRTLRNKLNEYKQEGFHELV